jgi:hypothetical protein
MAASRSPHEERPVAAFIVSLIAGLWMFASGGWMMAGGGWTGMMGGGMMGWQGYGGASTWMWHHRLMNAFWPGGWWSWIGLAAGILVIVGAVAVYAQPSSRAKWGITIIVASVVAMIMGTGGVLAGVLGIIGGVLALR